MGVKIRVSRRRLYLDIYWQGLRKWENLHLSLPEDKKLAKEAMRLAEIIRIKREQQLMAGEYGLQDIISGKQGLIDYAERLAGDQAAKNPLPKSLKYLREYAGTITLGGVNHAWVEGYRKFLLEQSALSESTAAKYLSALKNIIHNALRDRIIIRDPTEDVKGITIPDADTYHLTLAEIKTLAATPLGGELGAEVRRAFLFACYVGLRISDLSSLTWGRVSRDPPSIERIQQKTKARVKIPLHSSAWEFIKDEKIHHADEYIFPHLAKTKTNTVQYLRAWARKANIEKPLSWHVARRSFGTLALQAGGDLKTVSTLLGHKKITHTAKYLKTDSPTQQAVIDAIPELEILKGAEIVPIERIESEG